MDDAEENISARYERVKAMYADYLKVTDDVRQTTHTSGPHCDHLVLHAPGTCIFCDMNPYRPLHYARALLRIGYTNRSCPEGFRPCPATVMRSRHHIDRWGGNVAIKDT